jgi:hypothetical protein
VHGPARPPAWPCPVWHDNTGLAGRHAARHDSARHHSTARGYGRPAVRRVSWSAPPHRLHSMRGAGWAVPLWFATAPRLPRASWPGCLR